MPFSNAKSSPIAFEQSTVRYGRHFQGVNPIGAEFATLGQVRLAAIGDMAHKAVRMEVAEFQNTFFPLPQDITADQHPPWPTDIFDGLATGNKLTEQDIQARFVDAVNNNDLMPGLKISTASEKPDIIDMGNFKQKPDAAIFKADSVLAGGRPHWADQLVTVEFKRYFPSQDPFDDDDGKDDKVESDAEKRKEIRGQLIDYAELVFRIQHRTALFMILVISRRLRVLRWDRSGTIVTRAFDYVARPQLLCEILWRMSLLSDAQLGMDTSATRLQPSDTDYKLMDFLACESPSDMAYDDQRDLLPQELKTDRPVFTYVRDKFREAMDPKWPRYRVEVPDGNLTRTFLIGKPSFYAQGMACRGTKGFVAWDIKAKRFVWVKDAWRLDYDRMDQEGTILSRLNAEKVVFVPTLVCHGDIQNQKTLTPDIWEAQHPVPPAAALSGATSVSLSTTSIDQSASSSTPSLKRTRAELETEDTLAGTEDYTLRRHVHYRVVVEEVALPLKDFTYGQQLVAIIMDCIEAHQEAVEKANIAHRDVSSGNILILPSVTPERKKITWNGLLTDWELSKPIHEAEPLIRPHKPPRTGTWQFLSVGMLTENPKTVEIPDELESYLHVLLYFSVRYIRSNCKDPAGFIENYFDSYTYSDGVYTCGARKQHVIQVAGRLETGHGVPLIFDSPIDDIFARLLPLFKAHYKVQKYLRAKQKPAVTVPSTTCPLPVRSPALEPLRNSSKLAALREQMANELERFRHRTYRDDAPTAQEEKKARHLADHDLMLVTFYKAQAKTDRWRKTDKVGDRVPEEYKSQAPLANPHPVSGRTTKRRKTTGVTVAAAPDGFSSFPVRLTQSQLPKAG
ncbi:hypothetical protein ONZ51_g1142 [Trametes cubensis]|uniref:Fungal-type protein kinase domain-containing protein n=1 Tax=Trametes cubensis TaxID=1111947 RepID=A0AAD7U2P8_9APHY|nr:hypothetical protein ONZ51_g1142 [Trametes cubensis]